MLGIYYLVILFK